MRWGAEPAIRFRVGGMDLRRLISLTTLVDDGSGGRARAMKSSRYTVGGAGEAGPGPLSSLAVRIRTCVFGTDSDGGRIIVLLLTNHSLVLHRSPNPAAPPGGVPCEPSVRVLTWFSDEGRGIRCACLSANGRSLGVLTNDGAVYVLPLLKILTTLPARLFQAPTTRTGLPSALSLLYKRSGSGAKKHMDAKWASVDAVALPLPTFIGVNLEPILSLPISMSWVGNTGLALVFPNGIANVLDLTTCEVQWSGPAADIAGNDAIAKEVSGPGSRGRGSTGRKDTASTEEGLGGPLATQGRPAIITGAGSSSEQMLSPDSLPLFLVWSDTAVFSCVASLDTPATSCLQTCAGLLTGPFPRPDLVIRACAQAIGLSVAILPADYAPYPDRPTDRSTGPLDPINPVPEAHAGVLTDLIIQCYAACRALFSRSPGVFGNSAACGSHGPGSARPTEAKLRPRRAPLGTVAGVDVHRLLLTSGAYNAERAVSWLLPLGCAFECLLVGHARDSLPSVLPSLLTELGPAALSSASLEFLSARGHAELFFTYKDGILARLLPPPVCITLLASQAPLLVSRAGEVTSILPLASSRSLLSIVSRLHPARSEGLLPGEHTRDSALLFVLAALQLLAPRSLPSSAPSPHPPTTVDPLPRYPNADGGESDGDSVSSDDGRDGFDLPELLICLRALQPLYHPATTLSHCVQLKCYKAAALVCELAGDYISCLQCRLCDCCNGVEGDPSEACARALIDTLRDVNASALGDKKEDLISAAVNEAICFWSRQVLSVDPLSRALEVCLGKYGLPVAWALLPEASPPSRNTTGPTLLQPSSLSAFQQECVRGLVLPSSLLLAAVGTVCERLEAERAPHTQTIARELARKLTLVAQTSDAPLVIPYSSPLVTGDAILFTCGHSYNADDFAERVLPSFKASMQRLAEDLPRSGALCEGLYDTLTSSHPSAAIPTACPSCVSGGFSKLVADARPPSVDAVPPPAAPRVHSLLPGELYPGEFRGELPPLSLSSAVDDPSLMATPSPRARK